MNDKEHITAWVTKYALTQPIEKTKGYVAHDITSSMFCFDDRRTPVHGKEWHRTEAAALAHADEMRHKKIASMKKQIAKLEAMVFTVEDKT